VSTILIAKDIIHVENIIAILVVVSIILHSLARFGQYSARVPRRFVFERWVAYSVGGGEMRCQSLEGLDMVSASPGRAPAFGIIYAYEASFRVRSSIRWLRIYPRRNLLGGLQASESRNGSFRVAIGSALAWRMRQAWRGDLTPKHGIELNGSGVWKVWIGCVFAGVDGGEMERMMSRRGF
jgi:hypothetical protein